MRALLLLLVLGAAAGCGWHAGVEGPAGIRSVGVDVFANDTPEPDLEPVLSAAMADALERFAAPKLTSPSRADAVVRGKITDFRRRMGVRDRDNRLLETGASITVEAELVHARTGQVLRRTERHIWSDFRLGDSTADRRAARRALTHLAERIVLDLFRPVTYGDASPAESP